MKIVYTHIYIYNYNIYLHLKNPPHLLIYWWRNQVMKKTPEEKILEKGSASLLENSLCDSFQFLLVRINFLVFP